MKTKNLFIALVASLLVACGGSDSNGNNGSNDREYIERSATAQKGPVQPGSVVTFSNYSPETGLPTNELSRSSTYGYDGQFDYSYYYDEVTSNFGHFEVHGYFFNEVTGAKDDIVKLSAVSPLDNLHPTISVATDILFEMMYAAANDGYKDPIEVTQIGTDRLLDMFGYGQLTHEDVDFLSTTLQGSSDASAILLAMSATIMTVAEKRGEKLEYFLSYLADLAWSGNGDQYDAMSEELRLARFAVAYGPAYENTKAYFEEQGIAYEAPDLTYFLDVYGEMPNKELPIFNYLGCITTTAPAGSSLTLPVMQSAVDYQGRDITYEVVGTDSEVVTLNEFRETEHGIRGTIDIANVGESGEVNTFNVYFNTVLPAPANYEGVGCVTVHVE